MTLQDLLQASELLRQGVATVKTLDTPEKVEMAVLERKRLKIELKKEIENYKKEIGTREAAISAIRILLAEQNCDIGELQSYFWSLVEAKKEIRETKFSSLSQQ